MVVSLSSIDGNNNTTVVNFVNNFPLPILDRSQAFNPAVIETNETTTVSFKGSYFTLDTTVEAVETTASIDNVVFVSQNELLVTITPTAIGNLTFKLDNKQQNPNQSIVDSQSLQVATNPQNWIEYRLNAANFTVGIAGTNPPPDIEIQPEMSFIRNELGLTFSGGGVNRSLALFNYLNYSSSITKTLEFIVSFPTEIFTFSTFLILGFADELTAIANDGDGNLNDFAQNIKVGIVFSNEGNSNVDRIASILGRSSQPASFVLENINVSTSSPFPAYKVKIENNGNPNSLISVFGMQNLQPTNFNNEANVLAQRFINPGINTNGQNLKPFWAWANNNDKIALVALRLL